MAIPNAEKMMERAQRGERLTSTERRHCVAYLMATQPDVTNVALGELFGTTEKTIRGDKLKIREDKARSIKEDDIGLVIADIAINFDRQVRDIEASKRKADPGSRTYLEHCKAIFNLELERVKALQDLGWYPKNLGNMTQEHFVYKAFVTQGGAVDTRRVDNGDVIDVEPVDVVKQLSAPRSVDVRDAEFEDQEG
jgi:hypothetical protein